MLLLFLSKNSRRLGNLAAIVVKSMMVDSGDRGMEYVESGKGDEQIMMGCDYSEYDNPRRAAVACATRTFR
jgi:hypothetical protein